MDNKQLSQYFTPKVKDTLKKHKSRGLELNDAAEEIIRLIEQAYNTGKAEEQISVGKKLTEVVKGLTEQ